MNDCYYDKKDWRLCKGEVSPKGYLFPALALAISSNLEL